MAIRIIQYLQALPWVRRTEQRLHSIPFPGNPISLYEFGQRFIQKFEENQLLQKGYAVAFNFTLAVFPSIIFVFTLIPYVQFEGMEAWVFSILEDIMPEGIYVEAQSTILDIISYQRDGLLSLGFFMALFAATNGMNSLMIAFNSCYADRGSRRNFFHSRLIATFLTFLLAVILFLAVALLVGGKYILQTLLVHDWLADGYAYETLNLLRFVVAIIAFFFIISVIYYLAPSVHTRWEFISAGSLTATMLSVLFSVAFSYYFDNFSNYNKVYGSIGALMGLMLWLYAISLVLLTGFQINAILDDARRSAQAHDSSPKGFEVHP